jgi:tripartite-type tricarboxylate transporter receptor subunit TctC
MTQPPVLHLRTTCRALCLVLLACVGGQSQAQVDPAKPITLIVPMERLAKAAGVDFNFVPFKEPDPLPTSSTSSPT